MEGSPPRRRVLIGLLFFPRGGSALVSRSLARNLPAHGWEVGVASGSLGRETESDARRFFAGLDVHVLDYTEAASAADPLAHDPPMHPSYEDRPGAPDRVFARVDDATCERIVAVWTQVLADAGAARADVLHLNHLTPLTEAARRVAPDVPVVAHIHGTELLMLEQIAAGSPAGWDHAHAWARRMREWIDRAAAIVVLSSTQLGRLRDLLDVDPGRCTIVPNGYDPATFSPREVDRAAHWRRHLAEDPRGWRPGGEAGSVRYAPAEAEGLAQRTVLLYVGRYTAVKRIGLLIRAHARAAARYEQPAALVLLGGFPGEWEGEHPLDVVERCGAPDVFLAGWHDQDALPDFLAASDVVVLPSVREQFGQVLVEGMACGLPAIAVDAYGPAEIIDEGETGWLVPGDDEEALAAALVEAVNRPDERRRRGAAAIQVAGDRYSWPALAGRVAEPVRAGRLTAQEATGAPHTTRTRRCQLAVIGSSSLAAAIHPVPTPLMNVGRDDVSTDVAGHQGGGGGAQHLRSAADRAVGGGTGGHHDLVAGVGRADLLRAEDRAHVPIAGLRHVGADGIGHQRPGGVRGVGLVRVGHEAARAADAATDPDVRRTVRRAVDRSEAAADRLLAAAGHRDLLRRERVARRGVGDNGHVLDVRAACARRRPGVGERRALDLREQQPGEGLGVALERAEQHPGTDRRAGQPHPMQADPGHRRT